MCDIRDDCLHNVIPPSSELVLISRSLYSSPSYHTKVITTINPTVAYILIVYYRYILAL